MKTIVGPSWFLPQQRHLSAKVSWNWSVSSFVDEGERSLFPKVGGGKRHPKLVWLQQETPTLEERGWRRCGEMKESHFSTLSPLIAHNGVRGYKSLGSIILAERLYSKWIPCNRAPNPLKVPGWISNGLYGNINRIKITCNSVINEMSLVRMKCSAIKCCLSEK